MVDGGVFQFFFLFFLTLISIYCIRSICTGQEIRQTTQNLLTLVLREVVEFNRETSGNKYIVNKMYKINIITCFNNLPLDFHN